MPALEPLRSRYAAWLGMDAEQVLADRTEDPDRVRAIQLLLRLERDRVPSWHAALAAAASGCAALCLDARAEPGGEWFEAVHAYCQGHIRKVTRRGRGAQWHAAAALPGISLGHGDIEVRVLVPGLVQDLDRRVTKLQVGGTDVPVDDVPVLVAAGVAEDAVAPASTGGAGALGSADRGSAPAGGAHDVEALRGDGGVQEPAVALTVRVPDGGGLTAGKLMAQTGHAGMLAACLLAADDEPALAAWRQAGCPARVQRVSPGHWAELQAAVADPAEGWRSDRLLAVRDAGFTEVAPGTITVIGGLGGSAR